MRDRRRFRSFVLSTVAFVVLLVPLTAGAPMASGSGCDWACDDGFSWNNKIERCTFGGAGCMDCVLRCEK